MFEELASNLLPPDLICTTIFHPTAVLICACLQHASMSKRPRSNGDSPKRRVIDILEFDDIPRQLPDPAPQMLRGRRSTAGRDTLRKIRALQKKRKIVPGYTRTGGYYGRFRRGSELKFFDTTLSFTIDLTGEVPATGQLVLIPQGVTESTRVGRKCVIKSIQLRGQVRYTPGAGTNADAIGFVYLVLDKQCNGAAAAVTDVLTSNVLPTALINLSNSERFVIIKRFKWVFNSTSGVSTAFGPSAKVFDYFKKCNIPIEFSSTTGAIGEIRSNNLFLLAGATIEDDTITVSGTCRVRFSDN